MKKVVLKAIHHTGHIIALP